MTRAPATSGPRQATRILLDLSEGRLDADEVDAVAAWLALSSAADPTESVIERGLRARDGVYVKRV